VGMHQVSQEKSAQVFALSQALGPAQMVLRTDPVHTQ
jgi:hypothetical protein